MLILKNHRVAKLGIRYDFGGMIVGEEVALKALNKIKMPFEYPWEYAESLVKVNTAKDVRSLIAEHSFMQIPPRTPINPEDVGFAIKRIFIEGGFIKADIEVYEPTLISFLQEDPTYGFALMYTVKRSNEDFQMIEELDDLIISVKTREWIDE